VGGWVVKWLLWRLLFKSKIQGQTNTSQTVVRFSPFVQLFGVLWLLVVIVLLLIALAVVVVVVVVGN